MIWVGSVTVFHGPSQVLGLLESLRDRSLAELLGTSILLRLDTVDGDIKVPIFL